jgi:hypothetical protein
MGIIKAAEQRLAFLFKQGRPWLQRLNGQITPANVQLHAVDAGKQPVRKRPVQSDDHPKKPLQVNKREHRSVLLFPDKRPTGDDQSDLGS